MSNARATAIRRQVIRLCYLRAALMGPRSATGALALSLYRMARDRAAL
jgi:hypothetical protein